jgi:hypothetical protein
MASFISKFNEKISNPETAVLFLWSATIIVIIITFLAAFYKVRSAPQTVALHYNVIVGVDVLGSRSRLYQVPLTAAIIAGINAAFVKFLRPAQRFLPILLGAISLVCAIILLAATLFLYQVN